MKAPDVNPITEIGNVTVYLSERGCASHARALLPTGFATNRARRARMGEVVDFPVEQKTDLAFGYPVQSCIQYGNPSQVHMFSSSCEPKEVSNAIRGWLDTIFGKNTI